jgi:NADPH:quinone reductase-like Zn-dependent oxidoreductase
LNRAEVMYRTGRYFQQLQFPSKIGIEAAGVIEALVPVFPTFASATRSASRPANP